MIHIDTWLFFYILGIVFNYAAFIVIYSLYDTVTGNANPNEEKIPAFFIGILFLFASAIWPITWLALLMTGKKKKN